MAREPIETEKGGIAHFERGLWVAALEKLQEATFGVQQMKSARNRIDYEAGWTRFIDSLEEFWARFYDEGKSKFSDFQPWAGALDVERKQNQLLQYLIQCRHQSQHGRIALEWSAPQLKIAPGFSGHLRSLKIYKDKTYEIDARPLHPSVPKATVVLSPGEPMLPAAQNRKFKQAFPPPRAPIGAAAQTLTPMEAAEQGLAHYCAILKRAFERFSNPPLK